MRHQHSHPTPRHLAALLALLAAGVTLVGCAGASAPTRFTNPRFDFGYVERVAVVPFENLSNDPTAAPRVTRLVITELLASGAVDVVEPGEVQAALDRMGARITTPSTEQVVSLGQTLGVQAVLVGSVTQSEVLRSGAVQIPVVSLDVHMLETETGVAVWAANHTEKASGLGAKLLGAGGEPLSETTRRCVRRVLRSLIES